MTRRIIITILVLCCCCFGNSYASSTTAKEVHLYIKADVRNVTVRSLWIFQRNVDPIDQKENWIVELSLPKNAAIVDAGKMKCLDKSDVWQACFDPNVSIESVRFVYNLVNENGTADINVPLSENTEKMFVYIDKDLKNIGIWADQLQLNKFLTEKSNFAAVYTQNDIKMSQDAKTVMIRLVNLPVNAFSFWQKFCLASLGLMVAASLFTICKYKKKQAKGWLSNVFGIRRFWG